MSDKPREAGIIPLRSGADLERATASAERLLSEHDARLEAGDRVLLNVSITLSGDVNRYSGADLLEYLQWHLHCTDLTESDIAVDISAVKVVSVKPL